MVFEISACLQSEKEVLAMLSLLADDSVLYQEISVHCLKLLVSINLTVQLFSQHTIGLKDLLQVLLVLQCVTLLHISTMQSLL